MSQPSAAGFYRNTNPLDLTFKEDGVEMINFTSPTRLFKQIKDHIQPVDESKLIGIILVGPIYKNQWENYNLKAYQFAWLLFKDTGDKIKQFTMELNGRTFIQINKNLLIEKAKNGMLCELQIANDYATFTADTKYNKYIVTDKISEPIMKFIEDHKLKKEDLSTMPKEKFFNLN